MVRGLKEVKEFWEYAQQTNYINALTGSTLDDVIRYLHLKEILKPDVKILEVGVGTGQATRQFKEAGYNISGMDISERALNNVKSICRNIYLYGTDSLPRDYFDLIMAVNVIQHIPTGLLKDELIMLINALTDNGIFAMQFISSDLAEDTGTDINTLNLMHWDIDVGAYARIPEYMGRLINESNGIYKMVYDYRGYISDHVTGNHVFHIKKKQNG